MKILFSGQHLNISQLSSLGLSKGFNEYLGWLVFDAEGIFSGFLDGEAMHRSLLKESRKA